MIIKYVQHDIIAFEINNEIWYLYLKGVPYLYNKNLKRQIIPNIDNWIQSKTGLRYNYRSLCDMAAAFAMGANCSYTANDITNCSMHACHEAIDIIFKGPYINTYCKHYWIEILNLPDITKYQKIISNNFDNLRDNLGDDKFYKYLCRFRKTSIYLNTDYSVFEKLIRKLGLEPREPQYPDLFVIDDLIKRNFRDIPQHKNIDPKIIENIEKLRERNSD